ncbi:MAG TPA: glycosyltransferase family 4 protein [Anaerohalosphaeraceae bacterium]|jgi:glycosyltransferase involved in cell wall biosynthesis|nr:glycosyltransferase family 4 protein [Anaerohalosphaeraceae bacterium]HRT50949.1 glycosyltransferase family 4 protein [Anaerohalosphaeraceae bacterium]HRT86590.1 glycosyltransferase family 4 protein [Anaerohalosphaeraceae bacterium]
MKIVHVITRLILGGAQENTLITCRVLAERGHEVTLITGPAIGPEGALFEQTKNAPFETIVIRKLRREIRAGYDLASYFQLRKLIRQIRPDIVHTHSAKAGILGRFAADAVRSGPKRKRRPYIVHTIHGLPFHPYQSPLLKRFYIAAEKAAARRTDCMICVADAMAEKAIAAGIGEPGDFVTAYSAIDEQAFVQPPGEQAISDFRRKYRIGEQTVVIVCIARLAELKGHEYIIRSASVLAPKYENVVWLFVGDGALTEQIKSQIQLASLGYRFRFTGLLPPEQIPLAIHASDILVHCSLREGLARVLPQAMLCAKPVVSFDIDGAREVVNENTGFLIEPENVEQLVDACERLIQDPDLRFRLGYQGRESVMEKFAPETMVAVIESVYNHLIYGRDLNDDEVPGRETAEEEE